MLPRPFRSHLLYFVRFRMSSKDPTQTMPSAPQNPQTVTAYTVPEKLSEISDEEPKKTKTKKTHYFLSDFLDQEENWGKAELRPKYRPGRAWTVDELRLKGSVDLHKLWYVLLKERNMLLTMQEAYSVRAKPFPNPERIDRVKESMDGIEKVVHERNDSFLRLETGDSASPPMRRITSFMGFTYDEPAREHYEPFDKPAAEKTANKKEYEVPYLDDEAYLMQKLWAEKQQMRSQIELHDKYLAIEQKQATTPLRLRRPLRKSFNMVDHLPEVVVKRKLGIGDSTDKNDELFEQQV